MGKKMIEDALNRLAAAIEAQTAVQIENQRLFAELVARGASPAPAVHVVDNPAPETPKSDRKTKANKVSLSVATKEDEEIPAAEPQDLAEPEPESNARKVTKDDLKELAMSLSRQDSAMVPHIKATIAKHGVKTITDLSDTAVPAVFADLNNLAHKLARS